MQTRLYLRSNAAKEPRRVHSARSVRVIISYTNPRTYLGESLARHPGASLWLTTGGEERVSVSSKESLSEARSCKRKECLVSAKRNRDTYSFAVVALP